ncbi:glycosyltransferase family 2 protein [Rhodobacteraceae bacterium CCMM004]|nr:glycosyltransferase family 2 protein [Rhodobacteraceae bacterium CCMM004]
MSPRVAVLTAMRDEGPHLLEWVAHLRALGTADILVWSNDCADGSDALLDRLAEAGALTHLRNVAPEGRTPQWAALKAAAAHPALAAADWIAHLDCDEFPNLRPPLATWADLIAAVEGADAVVLPWRLFGHAGHVGRPAAPTIAAFDRAIPAAAPFPPLARFFKTLYRRAGPFQKPGIHRPRQRPGALPRWVDGSGAPWPQALAADAGRILDWGRPPAHDLVQLNHYSLRSVEDFLMKRRRGLPNRTAKAVDLTYWVERNFNGTEDRSIARAIPAMEAERARLRAQPGVAAAEEACRDWHRRTFAEMLRDPATVKLLGRLVLARDSTPPPPEVARWLVGLYAAGTEG